MSNEIGKKLSNLISGYYDDVTCSLPIYYFSEGNRYPAVFSFYLMRTTEGLKVESFGTLDYIDGDSEKSIDLEDAVGKEERATAIKQSIVGSFVNVNYTEFLEYSQCMENAFESGDFNELSELFRKYVPSRVIQELYSLVSPEYVSALHID